MTLIYRCSRGVNEIPEEFLNPGLCCSNMGRQSYWGR